MAETTLTTDERKKKTDWQLFTNDGNFDSKLPPSQRLHRTKDFKLLIIPMPRPKTSKLSEPSKPQPDVEHVENFIVVWLDQSVGKTKDSQTSKKQLKQIVQSVKIFMDPTECQTFMSHVKDEKIFVIISGLVKENFISNIHDEKQLESIYVLSPNNGHRETWFNEYAEIRGVYTSILSLCEQLGKDIKKLDHNLLGFEVMERSSSDGASKNSQQEALFMYDQLFRDIVLAISDENMQDMYEFCKQQYRGNDQAQLFINTFKQSYSSYSPVWWYAQESFLYRMLNKALRMHQYDTLYVLRVFIRHLHQAIVEQQNTASAEQKSLFRGQAMEKEDFERIRSKQGGLLSISNFLSTSEDRDVALNFARESLRDRRKVSVLMEIRVEKNTMVPVANVTDLSPYKDEKEWLFSIGSVFRIGSLEHLPDGIWVVPLTLTDDHDEQLNALREHFRKSMTDQNTCVNFAKLMYQLAAWKKSEYFYLMALQTETTWQRRSVFFNNLAMVKGNARQYDEALAYYNKSLQLKETAGDDSTSDKATTYNNIATLYYEQNRMDQATEYFQKAIEAANAQGNNNEDLTATLHANIAMILSGQGKYEEALAKCEEALEIRKRIFPAIHPDISSTYATIANIMHSKGSHTEAIVYIQKAIEIDRQALPPDHPQISLHMNNFELYKKQQSN